MAEYQIDREEFVRKIKEIKGSKVKDVFVNCDVIKGYPRDCTFEIVFDNGMILILDLVGYSEDWEIHLKEG